MRSQVSGLEVGVGHSVHNTRSAADRGKRRTVPVVRWLQLGTVATGIGVALMAAPGTATADGGAGSATASSSHSASAVHSGPTKHTTATSGRIPRPTAQVSGTRAKAPSAGNTPNVTGRFERTAQVSTPVTSAAPATAQRIGGSEALQSISDELQQFLAGAANRLANQPSSPVNTFLQDAVYLVRRALFPASVGVITRPIVVPLYFQAIDNKGTQKLGIYVSLGYGAPPQLFEFDTGAGGFYAAYASSDPTASPWWGSNITTSTQQVQDKFDSGLDYTGYAATGAVSLYSIGSSTPLITSGQVVVGQMNSITDSKTGDVFWTPNGLPTPSSPAPIDNAFYGDFGMAPTFQANGIDQVIAQLSFGRGVKPGYLVHVDPNTGEAWMQIGLTNSNIANSQGMYFPMNLDQKADGKTFNNSHLQFYALQLFNAAINIIDRNGTLIINDPNVGITPDTGANTTLHNTNLSPHPDKYNSIVDWDDATDTKGKLKTDMLFWLNGTTTGQTPVRYFQFVTTDKLNAGDVKVQNPTADDVVDPSKPEVYYLNTGISLFYQYDVVYYLGTTAGNGTLGLLPQSSH
jgi:hypothetical protein